MSQLWQSLAITAAIGGICMLAATFLVRTHEPEPVAITDAAPLPAQPAAAVNAFAGINLSGQAAIVVDLTTGETLYSENADVQLPLASLTKLLTMYAAQSALADAAPVPISSTSLAAEGESGLAQGETFAFADLARLTLVASSNDGAEAIAEAAAERRGMSETELLAAAARDAGLAKTYAVNGSGLDVDLTHSGGYGSARDVAKLAGKLLSEAPEIASASIKPVITIYSEAGVPHTLENTNPDVNRIPGLMLSKTGFTDLAGGNLAIVFDSGMGHPVAAVVLGSTRAARFTDIETLVKATNAHFAGLRPL